MENIIDEKSFSFAVKIVRLCRLLQKQMEFVLSKQLLKSGTSIGANVAEARQAQSRPDFLSKMNIALKECSETKYWLRLLKESDCLTESEQEPVYNDCIELERILTAIVKKVSDSLKK